MACGRTRAPRCSSRKRAAEAQTEIAEQRLYDARMNLVQQSWENGDDDLARGEIVEELPGDRRNVNRRGFEWYYWLAKTSSGLVSFNGYPPRTAAGVAFSPDCNRFASSRSDGRVTVWDVATGRETLTSRRP